MSSLKQKITTRYLASLDKEILECVENINIWCVSLQQFIKMKRKAAGRNHSDEHLFTISNAFVDMFYRNQLVPRPETYEDVIEKEDDEADETDEAEKNNIEDTTIVSNKMPSTRHANQQAIKSNTGDALPENEDDLDNFLRSQMKQEHLDKLTTEQKVAMVRLTDAENEEREMTLRINEKRRIMEEQKANPVKSKYPIKFSMDSAEEVKEQPKSNDETNDDIVEIENVEEFDNKLSSPEQFQREIQDVLKGMTADTTLHPLLADQMNNSIFNGLPGLDRDVKEIVPVTQPEMPVTRPVNTQSNIVTQKPIAFPDEAMIIKPLLRLNRRQQDDLQQRIYLQAKENVEENLESHISIEEKQKRIREESDKLLREWLEENQ